MASTTYSASLHPSATAQPLGYKIAKMVDRQPDVSHGFRRVTPLYFSLYRKNYVVDRNIPNYDSIVNKQIPDADGIHRMHETVFER